MLVKYLQGLSVRSVVFGLGAIGATATAIDIAMKRGLSGLQLVAVVCGMLATWALKWPGDVTAQEAKEREARARRDSMFPPGNEAVSEDLVDLIRKAREDP